MLYREIIAVCPQIHTKHINTLCLCAEGRTVSVLLYVRQQTTKYQADKQSSGTLLIVELQFCSDVSIQPVGPLFNFQVADLKLEDWTDNLSRNFGTNLQIFAI